MLTRHFLGELLDKSRLELSDESSMRLNLFRSRLTIYDLSWKGNEGRRFKLDSLDFNFSLHTLALKEVEVTHLSANGIELHLKREDEAFSVAGFRLEANQDGVEIVEETPEEAEPEVTGLKSLPLAFDIPFIELTDIQLFIDDSGQEHHVHLHKLSLERGFANKQQLLSSLSIDVDINGAKLLFNTVLDWLPRGGVLKTDMNITGLSLEPYLYLTPDIEGFALQSDLAFDAEFVLPPSDKPKLLDSQINIKQMHLALLNFKTSYEPWQLAFNDLLLSIEQGRLVKQGEDYALNLPLAFTINKIAAAQLQGSDYQELALLESIKFKDALVQGLPAEAIFSTPNLRLGELNFSKPENHDAFFKLNGLSLQQINANPNRLEIAHIAIEEFTLEALKDEQGEWLNLLLAMDEEAEVVQEPADSEAAPEVVDLEQPSPAEQSAFTIAVGSIELLSPSSIHMHDESTKPIFDLGLILESLTVGAVDSAEPDLLTDIALVLSDSQYYKQKLDVTWQLFNDLPSGTIATKMEQFPLYKVSPMLEHQLGFDILAGEMDMDYSGTVEKAQLDSVAKVLLRGPTFSSGDDDHGDGEVIGQAAVPLNIALNMLKDGKGNIKLKIPIDGDMNDPSFGLVTIFGTVAKKIVMDQAKSQLIKTFVPYGHLLGVAMAAGSYALKVRFADFSYVPGTMNFDEASAPMLDQLHKLLMDKPKVDLRLCPFVTSADAGVTAGVKITDDMHHKVLKLGQNRANYMKTLLVERGIASERLLLCTARYDADKDALPRVELQD
ncbi:DUF748 domain-containing protein [Agaribacterium sp. ZY112]|uniref:DUF748 domain-containing protein n=1 Tax=Agaribacterium sp. ZY112 TaxID=3233574 RepID=UPI0035239443